MHFTWYSDVVSRQQGHDYERLEEELPDILNELKKIVFIWKNQYMGYSGNKAVEEYFREHAYLDAQQTVEWDYFPSECMFNDVCYYDIVHSIIDFSGYAIKHVYCANVLNNLHPELINENLLTCLFTQDDLIALITNNRSISEEKAGEILDLLSLRKCNCDYYTNIGASCAPLIKISDHQYIISIRGFLDNAFQFVLFGLRQYYKKDWDKNVNIREEVFRTHLYSLFSDERFICIPHKVDIKIAGKVVTDIDAVVIDKVVGEIAFFQLKWQDPTGYSSLGLKSKSKNYNIQTQKWVDVVDDWIKSCDINELASMLGIPKKHIRKERIMLFILGRHHANYSGSTKPTLKCVWVQWYQLLHAFSYLSSKIDLSISRIYEYLIHTNPFNEKIKEPMNTFVYDKYRIHFGGGKT